MAWPAQITSLILVTFVVAVAIIDLRVRRIPNLLVFPAMAVGIVSHISWQSLGQSWSGALGGLKGVGMGFILLLIPYLVGGMKAGDVKFLMAIGAFVGWEDAVRVLLAAVMFYPLMAIVAVARERKFRLTWLRFRRVFWNFLGFFLPGLKLYALRLESQNDPHLPSVKTPFGVALAVGALIAQFTGFLR